MTPPIPPTLPNQIAEKLYYYTDSANLPVGPVPYSVLLRLADAKIIRPVDYVREKGTSEWVQFDSVCSPSVPPSLPKGEGETPVRSPRNLRSEIEREFGFSVAWQKQWLVPCFFPVAFFLSRLGLRFTKQAGIAAYAFLLLMIIAPFVGSLQSGKGLDRTSENGTQKGEGGRSSSAIESAGTNGPANPGAMPSASTPGRKNVGASSLKTYRASDFIRVFNGGNPVFVNDAAVENLPDMVEAIYAGTISPQQASRYAFIPNTYDAGLKSIVGQFLIFEVSPQGESEVEFAMQRDPAFERAQVGPGNRYRTVEEYYEDEFGGATSNGPLARGPVMIVGMTQFVTGQGLVKLVPLVETIDIRPSPSLVEPKSVAPSPRDILEQRVKGVMQNVFGSYLKTANVTATGDGKYSAQVEFAFGTIATGESAKRMADRLMTEAYEKLFEDQSLNIETATIALDMPVTDKFGKKSVNSAYRTRMGVETANRVRWDKQNGFDFTWQWETRFLHPDLQD